MDTFKPSCKTLSASARVQLNTALYKICIQELVEGPMLATKSLPRLPSA